MKMTGKTVNIQLHWENCAHLTVGSFPPVE